MSIEKISTVTARFRSVRLLADDLRAIESELQADEVSWRIGSREQLGTWSWKNVHTRSQSLDELSGVAPKGRVHEFEMQAKIGEQSFVLLMVSREPRFITFSYEGPGEEMPDCLWAASSLLKRAEKRGEKWHIAGAAVGPALALTVPLMILDSVGNLGLLREASGPSRHIGAAVGWAIASFLVLALVPSAFWSWATASSVTLRPIIDAASMVERSIERAKSAGMAIVSFPKEKHIYNFLMLWATVVAALCGIGGFVVAVLK